VRRDGTTDGVQRVIASDRFAVVASNGLRFAAVSKSRLLIVDRDFHPIANRPLPFSDVTSLALAPDGSGIATAASGRMFAFDSSGTILVTTTLTTRMVTIAANGDRYLLAWNGGGAGAIRMVVDASGHTIAGPLTIAASDPLLDGTVTATPNGDGWTMAYVVAHGINQSIAVVDVAPDGTLRGSPRTIASETATFFADAIAGSLLLYRRSLDDAVHGVLFRDAMRIDIPAVTTSALRQHGASIAPASSGSFLTAWIEDTPLPRVRVARVTASDAGPATELRRGNIDADVTAVATGGALSAVAFAMDRKLWVAIVATNDASVVVPPFAVFDRETQNAGIAWNGFAFQLVATDANGIASSALIATDGSVTQAGPLVVNALWPLTDEIAVACGGGQCVAAWSQGPPRQTDMNVVRFDSAGRVLAQTRVTGGDMDFPRATVDALFVHDLATRLTQDLRFVDATRNAIGVSLGVAVLAATRDGVFTTDWNGNLFFSTVAFTPQPHITSTEMLGRYDYTVQALARSGSANVAIVQSPEQRLFVRALGNSLHGRATAH